MSDEVRGVDAYSTIVSGDTEFMENHTYIGHVKIVDQYLVAWANNFETNELLRMAATDAFYCPDCGFRKVLLWQTECPCGFQVPKSFHKVDRQFDYPLWYYTTYGMAHNAPLPDKETLEFHAWRYMQKIHEKDSLSGIVGWLQKHGITDPHVLVLAYGPISTVIKELCWRNQDVEGAQAILLPMTVSELLSGIEQQLWDYDGLRGKEPQRAVQYWDSLLISLTRLVLAYIHLYAEHCYNGYGPLLADTNTAQKALKEGRESYLGDNPATSALVVDDTVFFKWEPDPEPEPQHEDPRLSDLEHNLEQADKYIKRALLEVDGFQLTSAWFADRDDWQDVLDDIYLADTDDPAQGLGTVMSYVGCTAAKALITANNPEEFTEHLVELIVAAMETIELVNWPEFIKKEQLPALENALRKVYDEL